MCVIIRRAAKALIHTMPGDFILGHKLLRALLKMKWLPTFEKINPREAASQLVTGWMEVSDVILIPFKFILSFQ